MYQSNRRFNIPRTFPGRAFDAFAVPGSGEFDHNAYGVGNYLNSNLDFVLRVPVNERGSINHGGGRNKVQNGEFNDFKRKDFRFVTTWIKSEGLQTLFLYFRLGAGINS